MGSWSPLAAAIQKSCLAASLALACLGRGSPAAARPWPEIVRSGQLRVAVKDNLRPLGFRDPEGKLQGFEIELARELGSRLLGSREAVELVPVANVERLQAVAAGEVDLAVAQIGITPDRARQVEFTSAYYQDGPSLVVARSQNWTSWSELRGARVAVLRGSAAIPHLNRYLSRGRVGAGGFLSGRGGVALERIGAGLDSRPVGAGRVAGGAPPVSVFGIPPGGGGAGDCHAQGARAR
jgi:ABC-type amino acid transport substrate-binding protein